jgi:hypothetical protein
MVMVVRPLGTVSAVGAVAALTVGAVLTIAVAVGRRGLGHSAIP